MDVHFIREVDHWRAACQRLREAESFASTGSWQQLESYTGLALRERLNASVSQLVERSDVLFNKSRHLAVIENGDRETLQELRRDYLRTEVTLDYFGDAINTRTDARLGSHLAALDFLAVKAMKSVLQPLGHQVPPVLTYIDKGLGASILKAGLRLWDKRGVNPVAVIKVVRHNLFRPTALIHEAGHQIAYITNWNRELAAIILRELTPLDRRSAEIWSSWASEIAADAFAFTLTGYGAVATLRDVLAGGPGLAFQFHYGAPHPIPYLRTLLGVAMCRHVWQKGPWDQLGQKWQEEYPISSAPPRLRSWLAKNIDFVDRVARLTLSTRMNAFGGRSLREMLPVDQLRPHSLLSWQAEFGTTAGLPIGFLRENGLRLLGLSVYRQATESQQNAWFRGDLRQWLSRLGKDRLAQRQLEYA